jgi:hypothetical protein
VPVELRNGQNGTMASIVYVGPTDLRGELEGLIRSKGLSVESTASQEPGCDYESTTLAVEEPDGEDGSLDRLCHHVVAEWNAK